MWPIIQDVILGHGRNRHIQVVRCIVGQGDQQERIVGL